MTDIQSDSLDEEFKLTGVPIIPGLALGKAFFCGAKLPPIQELTLPQEDVEHEIRRYYNALRRSRSEIRALQHQREDKDIKGILDAHLAITEDPLLTKNVAALIRDHRKNAEFVLSSVVRGITASFTKNQMLVDRVADIQDVSMRIFENLNCSHRISLKKLEQNLIVFADLLMPSDIVGANPTYIRGMVSRTGSKTSHTAIVLQAKGTPYIANFPEQVWEQMQKYNGKLVLLRGLQGEIIFNPTPSTLQRYYKQESSVVPQPVRQTIPTTTYVSAQAFSAGDLEKIQSLKVPVGLFRSEFLSIASKKHPSFEEQVQIYTQLAMLAEEGPVIRLFDFNYDKPCFLTNHMSCERSVRWLLQNPAVLQEQLRAILEASIHGKIKILIPGVIDVSEIVSVKQLMMKICRGSLPTNIIWGSMIEFPSAVWMIDELLVHCDFISIGTNDLSHYTLGRSREHNCDSDSLSSVLHPSVVRMIYHVVRQAQQKNIPVCICGEAAADLSLTPFFVGLGVQELSVAVPMVPIVRQQISSLDIHDCAKILELLLKAPCSQDINNLLKGKASL